MGRGLRGESADRGAAALEFALVVPILLLLVFGIINFGLFFSNSLGVRSGVRESARNGVVQNFSAGDCTGYAAAGDPNLSNLACLTLQQSNSIGGDAYVQVVPPSTWNAGKDLLVCAVTVQSGIAGSGLLPDGGVIRERFQMRIEQDDAGKPRPTTIGTARTRRNPTDDTPAVPQGGWAWCA